MKNEFVKVSEVKEFVNSFLSSSVFSQEEKKGMIAVLETILHSSNNYEGYEYLYMERHDDGDYYVVPGSDCSRRYI